MATLIQNHFSTIQIHIEEDDNLIENFLRLLWNIKKGKDEKGSSSKNQVGETAVDLIDQAKKLIEYFSYYLEGHKKSKKNKDLTVKIK